ncbi:hypothetical protein [Streptomyces sp. NPDC059631]|uniref:hypothetical protein n=1 Tax=unclassified Streptomyces TaxID=2593676 RepID=UPI0036979AA6
MHELPDTPGHAFLAAACCALAALTCLLAAAITATLEHRKAPTTVSPVDPNDPRTSPDWCWTHQCPGSQCPPPPPQPQQ